MEEKIIKYDVLNFTEYPGPRYKAQGQDSGEEFYEEILKPKFEEIESAQKKGQRKILQVNLDNTAGYASSFLDEAFGNLAYDYGGDFVVEHLEIISNEEPDWIQIILHETIPEWERKKRKGTPRKPGFAEK